MGDRAEATLALAGSAMLGALAVALDYALKYTGLKDLMSAPWAMAFPHLYFLKFDIDGVPIFCAMSFFGLAASGLASTVLGLAIFVRAPHLIGLVGGAMKGLAEFSTVAGAYLGLRLPGRRRWAWTLLGPLSRAGVMSLANLVVTPLVFQWPFELALALLPFIALFNLIQGAITTYLGLAVALAVLRRASHVLPAQAPILRWSGG